MEGRALQSFVNPAYNLKFPYKIFVKEKEIKIEDSKSVKKIANTSKGILTGTETKDFYESVICENSTIDTTNTDGNDSNIRLNLPTPAQAIAKQQNSSKVNSCVDSDKSTKGSIFSKKQILVAIQNDNAKLVKLAFERGWGKSILYDRDQYGWTSLMIASCAGALKTFKIILNKGADIDARDRSGNTCLSLAKKNRHYEIINLINKYIVNENRKSDVQTKVVIDTEADLLTENICELCKVTIRSSRLWKHHLSSTTHLLNVEREEIKANGGHAKVHYGIPQANRGYQIMLSSGWNSNVGLGPCGKGKLYPVKTVLKRDKHGLGLEVSGNESLSTHSKKPKVTHFAAYDSSSVKSHTSTSRTESSSTLSRKERTQKSNKVRRNEIDFRREFMTL